MNFFMHMYKVWRATAHGLGLMGYTGVRGRGIAEEED